MTLIDHLTPTYYRVKRMGVQEEKDEIGDPIAVAIYDVEVLNASGRTLDSMAIVASLTAQEQLDILAIITRDKAQFETNTSLTEWVEPEEP